MRNLKSEIRSPDAGTTRSVLECGGPPPLFLGASGTGRAALPRRRWRTGRFALPDRLAGTLAPPVWMLLFCLCASAQDYTNKWFTVNGGGQTSTNGMYTITGTVGQPDAGVMRRGEYTVNGGFWGMIAVVQTPGAPLLTIRGAGSSSALVCWPYPSEGYGLQQCTNLITATWVADASVRVQVGNEWQVTVSPPAGRRYYRLQKP